MFVMAVDRSKSIVLVLAVCQGLAFTGNSLIMTISALAGYMLAPDASLATLPLALQHTAIMAATVPASLLMKRIGRRAGFSLGLVIAAIAGLVSCYAVLQQDFVLFCAGAMLYGVFAGFALFYRFAAADSAAPEFRARAISYVLAGGLIAALLGPQLANLSQDWLAPVPFAGGYLVITGLAVIGLGLMLFLRIPPPTVEEQRATGRPLAQIVRQPVFVVAVLAAMIGYGMMTFVMTATPLAMYDRGLDLGDTALVIQWHLVGMFGPSFFTGHLIKRFGVLNVMLAGVLLYIACVAANLSGVTLVQFWSGLLLLGLGWNFLFVGATTLVTETYAQAERAKTQAVNDFLVYASVALASFASGAVNHLYGWQAVNLALIVPIVLVGGGLFWLKGHRRAALA